jgi:hypothetical protein
MYMIRIFKSIHAHCYSPIATAMGRNEGPCRKEGLEH